MTFGEVLLWNELKENKFGGFDFDRQRCVDNYIVDFYCKELCFAIEVDGMYHFSEEASAKDDIWQTRLEELGVTFVRFTEYEVKNDIVNVIRGIEGTIIDIIKKRPDVKLPKEFDTSVLE